MGHLIHSPREAIARPVDGLPGTSSRSQSIPVTRLWLELLGSAAAGGDTAAAMDTVARRRQVAQGDCVFKQHDVAHSLVLLAEGEAALGWIAPDGHFRIERPVRGPGWLDQSSAWVGARHAIDARAISDVLVVELPCNDMKELLPLHPQLAGWLISGLAQEVHALAVNTHGLMHLDAPARFAQWLLSHCRPLPGSAQRGVVRLGERKRDIASQLAITPETLSRLMRSLSRQGLIAVSGYTVDVADLEGLRRLAQSG